MLCVSLNVRWVSWIWHTNGSWLYIQFASLCYIQFASLCLLIGAFSPFTFKINIFMCDFDSAILMLTGCFAQLVDQFLHYVDGLYHLVCFWGGWYWLFLSMFSASFRSSPKAALVVTKSLSNCLFIKDFISPSRMKLSLSVYEILDWKFVSLRMLKIGPHSLLACKVSAERSTVSLMGFPLWVTRPFSLAAFSIFSFISTLVNWWLCALGLLFLRNIFVVFSVFPGLECWPALLGWWSSPG